MKMDDVELVRSRHYTFEHHDMHGNLVDAQAAQPECFGAHGHQRSRGAGVGAGKKRDLMPEAHELLGEE